MLVKVTAKWHSLRPVYQSIIVGFVSAFIASLAHAATDAGIKDILQCPTWGCAWTVISIVFKITFSPHSLFTAIVAGFGAGRVFLMLPSNHQQQQSQQQSKP